MRTNGGSWVRGAVVLALVAALAAMALLSPVGAALKKGKVKKIAGKLDAMADARVAYVTNTEDLVQLDPTGSGLDLEQLSTTITAPAPGFLVLDLWMESGTQGDGSPLACYFELDGTKVQTSELFVTIPTGGDDNCISHAVEPVGAGTHSVKLFTYGVNTQDVVASEMGLSAVYVPFDGSGNRP